MKKLILLTAVIFSIIISFAFIHKSYTPLFDSSLVRVDSFPNNASVSNASTLYHTKGGFVADGGSIITRFRDTATANLNYISQQKGGQIIVGNTVFIRDSTATRWIAEQGNGGSNISIINDSSIAICNLNSCDTFTVSNIVINNFSILNDSTIQVCDTTGTCDTININPTPFNKPYVDSTIIRYSPDSVGVDTLYYAINGNKFLSGYIIRNTNDSFFVRAPLHVDYTSIPGHRIIYIEHADGLVSGGIVTWSGTGLKFYVSPATYWINGQYYESGLDSVTLAQANSTYSRYDLFVLDTTGHANKVTGEASMSPTVPQVDLGSQIALTNAFLVNPGDTVPSNVSITVPYDEDLQSPTEWDTARQGAVATIDWANTNNPKHLTKAIFISKYTNGSNPYLTTSTPYAITSDAVLSGWVYLNGKFTNGFYVSLFNTTTHAATTFIPVPINKNDSSHWQQFTLPLSAFTWSGNTTNTFNLIQFRFLGADTSGAKGLYIDWITLQKGVNNIPSQTDYSNKLDSVYLRNDSLFQYVKGVETFRGKATGSGGGGGGIGQVIGTNGILNVNDSTVQADTLLMATRAWRQKGIDSVVSLINAKLNISDTAAMLSPYPNREELSDTAAAIRADFPTAGAGTVTSIAKGYGLVADGTITTTGTITVDSAALSLKYLRIADTAAMLSPSKTAFYHSSAHDSTLVFIDANGNHVDSSIFRGGNSITGGSITWAGTLYSTPTTGTVSGGILTFNPSLVSQSAYTNFGNNTGSSAAPVFFTNKFSDSSKRSTDSIFRRVNGSWIFQYKDSTGGGGSSGWSLNGNSGTSDTTFIGTLGVATSSPFNIRVGNTPIFRSIYTGAAYRTGIGTGWNSSNEPQYTLDVNGAINTNSGVNLTTAATNSSYKLIPGSIASNFASGSFQPITGTNVGMALTLLPLGTGFSSSIKTELIIANSTVSDALVVRAGGTTNGFSLAAVTGRPIWIDATGSQTPATSNAYFSSAGNTLIGTQTDITSAKVVINSTTQGLRIPTMTKTQRDAISSPTDGLQVIVTGVAGGTYLSWYDLANTRWVKVTSVAD